MTKKASKGTKSTKATTSPSTSTATSPASSNHHAPSRDDRGTHRVPIQLLVDYKCDGNYLFDFCRDLGTGGIFIETNTPLAMGSNIELTFTIPDSKETLRTTGRVIWSQAPIADRKDVSPGMGVQFSEFNQKQRSTLDEFMKRYGGTQGAGAGSRRAG